MVSSILAFTYKMASILKEAKIKLSYVSLPEKTENIPHIYLEDGLSWVTKVHDEEFAACMKTKTLVSEEQWQQYKFLDMDGAAEVIELKQRFRALRKRIINKERPAVFRRKIFNAPRSKKTEEANVQGVGQGAPEPLRDQA